MSDQYDGLRPGQVLADASVAEFISTLGLGIAEAQRDLDTNSIEQLDAFIQPIPGLGGRTLISLGFMPAFYHYQHADISCSMNLQLKVKKELGVDFGINASYESGGTEDINDSSFSSDSSSGSRQQSEYRTAKLNVQHSSTGSITVGGETVQLQGATARARLDGAADQLRNSQNVERVELRRSPSEIPISTDANPDLVMVGKNMVAIMDEAKDIGIFRISNTDEFQIKFTASKKSTVPTSESIEAHLRKTIEAIFGKGFVGLPTPPGKSYGDDPIYFDWDKDDIRPDQQYKLLILSPWLKSTDQKIKLRGHTDRSGSDSYNLGLAKRRVESVRQYLIAGGVDTDQFLEPEILGESEPAVATEDGEPKAENRRVEIILSETEGFILITGDENLSNPTPNKRNGGEGNGWIFLSGNNAALDMLNGKKVTVDGKDITLNGAAAGGAAKDFGRSFAANLATDANDGRLTNIEATPLGNVVHFERTTDQTQIILHTKSSRDLQVSSTSGITVTEQFSRERSERKTEKRTGNKAVAVGASLNVRYSRQFEMDVTGNSSISARLVSVPPPDLFAEAIQQLNADQEDG